MIEAKSPLVVHKKHKFVSVLKKIKVLSSDVKQFQFTIPQGFEYQAGAYVNINFVIDGKPMGRAYSIASFGCKSSIELCIKLVPQGVGSGFLFSLQEGDSVKMIGPLGHFFIPQKYFKNNTDIIFICVGTGVAPFRAMIQDLLLVQKVRNSIGLLSGFRKESGILYQKEWEEFQHQFCNFFWENTLSQPDTLGYRGQKGRIQTLLENIFQNPKFQYATTAFYICGLSPMIREVEALLISKGISQESIHYESYD